jgi:hypothetical protein
MRKVLGAAVLMGTIAFGTLAGCGDDPDPIAARATGDDGGPTPADDAAPTPANDASPSTDDVATEFCKKTYDKFLNGKLACCEDAKGTYWYGVIKNLYDKTMKACAPGLQASIQRGRLAHNPALAAKCYADVDKEVAQGCASRFDLAGFLRTNASCNGTFAGTVDVGGACRGNIECKDGLTCVGSTADVDGTCRTTPVIGETCGAATTFIFGTHRDCVPEAYCNLDTDKCTLRKADGAECLGDVCRADLQCFQLKCSSQPDSDLDGPCRFNNDCKSGLYCDSPPITGQPGTCKKPKPSGSSCVSKLSGECEGVCEVPDGGTTGTCIAFCGSG